MPQKRPYFQVYDASLDLPIQQQVDDPANLRLLPQSASNARTVIGSDSQSYIVGDAAVNPRGAKSVIWSSEGYTSLGSAYNSGIAIPALTANQKKASGSVLSASTGNIGTLLGASPPPLDFSPYRTLMLIVNLVSFTAGTSPTIRFELDMQDDTATPVTLALWKPAALSAAGSLLVSVGPGVVFAQAPSAGPDTAPTGFGTIAVPTGWTYYPIPLPFLPNGNVQWTVTGAPTTIAWSAWLYGSF